MLPQVHVDFKAVIRYFIRKLDLPAFSEISKTLLGCSPEVLNLAPQIDRWSSEHA
jgi:hypothetical protein